MKILLVALIFFNLYITSFGQEVIGKFDLTAYNLNDVQIFPFGDSVFLTYTDRIESSVSKVKKAFWVTPSGNKTEVNFDLLQGIPILGATRESDDVYFYYSVVENGVGMIKVVGQTSPKDKPRFIPGSFAVEGQLIGSYSDQQEFLWAEFLKEGKRIKISSIKGDKMLNVKFYDLPFSLKPFIKSSSGIISVHDLIGADVGSAKLKIHKAGNFLNLCVDKQNKKHTSVLKLNLKDGSMEELTFPAVDEATGFASFYFNDKLYRISSVDLQDKKVYIAGKFELQCSVFEDGKSSVLFRQPIRKPKHESEEVPIVVREGSRYVASFGEVNEFKWVANNMGDLSIVVEPVVGSTNVRIMMGSYFNDKAVGMPSFSVLSPIAIIGGLLVSNAINQLEGAPGISRYFVISGNDKDGYAREKLKGNLSSARLRIDNYEHSRTVGAKERLDQWHFYLKYVGYASLPDGALGVYVENKKGVNKLYLIKF